AARICVGTTNIRTVDSRPGVTYLSMIHKALAQSDFEAAVSAIVDAERSGAHYYYVADARGHAAALECTPRRHRRIDIEAGSYVHCNHCLVAENAALEGETPAAS